MSTTITCSFLWHTHGARHPNCREDQSDMPATRSWSTVTIELCPKNLQRTPTRTDPPSFNDNIRLDESGNGQLGVTAALLETW